MILYRMPSLRTSIVPTRSVRTLPSVIIFVKPSTTLLPDFLSCALPSLSRLRLVIHICTIASSSWEIVAQKSVMLGDCARAARLVR